MNSSAIKLFFLSVAFLLVVAGATAYAFYEQEKNGEAIRSSLRWVKAWGDIQQVEGPSRGKQSPEKDALLNYVLASESDTVKLLAFIDELSSKTGVAILVTNLKREKTREVGFDELSVSFAVRGDREEVEGVVKILEVLPYRSHVTDVSLSRNSDGTADANVNLSVSVKE